MSSIKDLLKDLKADNMPTRSVEKKEDRRKKDLLKDLKADMPTRSVEKKGDRRKACCKCGKAFSHHKQDCRDKIPILKLKWNGSLWQRDNSCEKWYYQMKLGRDLDNLIRKRAINEDVLNATQKSYLQMYREMFID